VALVLLRIALGMTGIAEGLTCFTRAASLESYCFGIILLASGGLVSVGLLTPYAAMIAAITAVGRNVVHLALPPSTIQQSPLSEALIIVVGVALALLGPGLFSLDFRLFGHREIVIPRRGQD
jgi:uncharacterized membrane protein YphA (DoxX/SURF4 family)